MAGAQQATVAALVAAHASARDKLTASTSAYAAQQVETFQDWYDTAAIAALADRVAGRVQAGQRQVAAVTDAYLSRVLSALAGRHVPQVGVSPTAGRRRGVEPAAPYGRVTDLYRYQRSLGVPEERAVELAVDRARVAAETDVSLAFRDQAHTVMVKRPVDGWRRIVHPELSKGGTCGLCIAASDRVYRRGDLMPLHARCECTVLPVVNGVDPGASLDGEALAKLYAEAGSTAAADLKRVRYTVHDHGELGPVLARHGDQFRTETQAGADTRRDHPGERETVTAGRTQPALPAVEPAGFDQRAERAVSAQAALDATPLTLALRDGELTVPSGAERAALYDYSGQDYAAVNRGLRRGSWLPLEAPAEAMVPHLDSALARSPLTADAVVWRGSTFHPQFFGEHAGGDLTGYAWQEKAYSSTSARRDVAELFAAADHGVVMRLLLPRGTGAVALSGMDTEAELLLARDMRFRVAADRGVDARGRRLLDVEAL